MVSSSRLTFTVSLALALGAGACTDGDDLVTSGTTDGELTTCTVGSATTDPERYDFALLQARIDADPSMTEVTGIAEIRTCEDARIHQRLMREHLEAGLPEVDAPLIEPAGIKGGNDVTAKRGVVWLLRADGKTCTGFMLNRNIVVTAAHCLPSRTGRSGFTIYYFDPDTNTRRQMTAINEQLAYRQFPSYAGDGDDTNDTGIIVRTSTWPGTDAGDYLRVFDDRFSQVGKIRAWGAGLDGFHGAGGGDLEWAEFDIDWFNSNYAITRGSTRQRICRGDSGGPAVKQVGSTDLVVATHSSIQYDLDSNGNCSGPGMKQRHTRVNYGKMIWLRQAAGSILGGGDVACSTGVAGSLQYFQCF